MTRLVLALVALLALVGGIAWLNQYLPNYRAKQDTQAQQVGGAAALGSDLIQFTHQRAIWDRDDPTYFKEIEKGDHGVYLFPFRAPGEQAAELGFYDSKCDCARLEVALLPEGPEWDRIVKQQKETPGTEVVLSTEPTWTALAVHQHQGAEIPPGARGLVRISWNGRKDPGVKLALSVTLWVQPKGQSSKRLYARLDVPVIMAAPLQFTPPKVDLGIIGPGESATGEFTVWSTTRPTLDWDFPAKKNAPLVISTQLLSADQVRALRDKFKKQNSITTHLQCAYLVKVRVEETKLDLGAFYKPLTIHLDGFPLGGNLPVVEGTVKGNIDVGGLNDQNKVQLESFQAQDGRSLELPLWSDAKLDLTHHDHHPSAMKVKLTKNDKESTAMRSKWLLEVVVPPNSYFGPFTEDCAIWLRLGTNPPRLMRIPVTGNAG